MKRSLLSISICLAAAVSPAFGWVGGPFSNDSPLSTGGSGTYQGIASGKNLLGIAIFGYSETLGSTGRWVFFHEGVLTNGSLQSVVDFPGRQIVGIMGGTNGRGAFEAHINSTRPIVTAVGEGELAHGGPPSTVSTTITSSASDAAGNKINETVAKVDSDTITVTSSTSNVAGKELNKTEVTTSNTDKTKVTSTTSDGEGNQLGETVIETENTGLPPEEVVPFDIRLTRTSVVVGNFGDGSGAGGDGSGGDDSGSDGSSGDGSGSDESSSDTSENGA